MSADNFPWVDMWEKSNTFSLTGTPKWADCCESTKGGIELHLYVREAQGREKTGSLEYLSYGWLPLDQDVYFAMLVDTSYRKEWDASAVECSELSDRECHLKGALGPVIIEMRAFKMPSPMGVQEYLQAMTTHEEIDSNGQSFRCIGTECLPSEEGLEIRPVAAGAKRVTDQETRLACAPSGNGVRFAYYYFEDTGKAPHWLMKAATARGVPKSLVQQVEAAIGYPDDRMVTTLKRHGIQSTGKRVCEAAPTTSSDVGHPCVQAGWNVYLFVSVMLAAMCILVVLWFPTYLARILWAALPLIGGGMPSFAVNTSNQYLLPELGSCETWKLCGMLIVIFSVAPVAIVQVLSVTARWLLLIGC